MTCPDFFLVGAPKCGTTSVFESLRAHPEIFMVGQKETNHFATDLQNISMVSDNRAYQNLFANAGGASRLGEASVWYLFSRAAVANIHRENPEARILILLRNPIDAFVSLHNHYILSLQEDEFDPEAAWRAQDRREKGENLPYYCPDPALLQYRAIFNYVDQVRRYRERFGHAQIRVCIFENLLAHPERELVGIFKFLGVDPAVTPVFARNNSARQFLSPALARTLTSPPRPLGAAMLAGKKILNRVGIRPIRLLHKLTRPKDETPGLSDNFRVELRREFDPGVRQLEWLLDISLADVWWPSEQRATAGTAISAPGVENDEDVPQIPPTLRASTYR